MSFTVLTRDEIKAVDDRKIEPVAVPEWAEGDQDPENTGVYVQGLSGTDRDSFEMAMVEQRKDKKGKTTAEVNLRNLRAKLVVRCAVDSDDPRTAKRIFTDDDVEWVGTKSAAALQRVYAVAQRLSGLSNEDVEELTAELGNDQSDASGSDSPSPSDIEASPIANDGSPVTSSPSGSPSTDSSPSGTDG